MITSDLTTNSSNPVERALEEFREQVLEPCGMKFLIVGSLALHKLGMEVDGTSRHRHGGHLYT